MGRVRRRSRYLYNEDRHVGPWSQKRLNEVDVWNLRFNAYKNDHSLQRSFSIFHLDLEKFSVVARTIITPGSRPQVVCFSHFPPSLTFLIILSRPKSMTPVCLSSQPRSQHFELIFRARAFFNPENQSVA